ncbi:hypothetical protein NDU88_007734 [Pleurodeles waltl]|uniref:Uncharacterized protein n=1 Tax=Pleurodeles waltl TaxID=8319 RepID=A0AAV7NVR5_PLEWA|nr:hypothetical protein NDU88_007734 [Pleurodeles waltl]
MPHRPALHLTGTYSPISTHEGGRPLCPSSFTMRQPCLGKSTRKSACQLLGGLHSSTVTSASQVSDLPETTQTPKTNVSIEHILQEITVVGRTLKGMDTRISDLTAESRSIRADIASFQDKVTVMDHRLSLLEDKLNSLPNRDQELQYLWDKIMNLEDRSCRDNIRFFGFPEWAEGTDVKTFLLPTSQI